MRAAGTPYDNGFRRLSKAQLLSIILADDTAGRDIRICPMRSRQGCLESGAHKHFGSYRAAVRAAGWNYRPLKPLADGTWPKALKTLVRLYKEGVDLRFATFKRTGQSIFAAARYYYGKYYLAVEVAGISYRRVLQR
jgi:hypothetical protein